MLSRQFVCGRRSKAVFSVFFLLSATYSFGMEAEYFGAGGPSRSDKVTEDDLWGHQFIPGTARAFERKTAAMFQGHQSFEARAGGFVQRSFLQERSEVVETYKPAVFQQKGDSGLVPALTDEEKESYSCNGYTWEEMMDSYNGAPDKAQMVAEHLKQSRDPVLRAAFFVGPPGTGKTTTALAIPHLAHWYFDPINAGDILSRYRNETKDRLALHFKRALNSGKKVVVIIDEINRLLENFKSKKHDSDATASFIWTFLDSQRRNDRFFLIGTMNHDDKLPEPFKNRKGGTTVYFKRFSPDKQREIFKKKIVSPQLELDPAYKDEEIDSFIKILGEELIDFSPRDYENLRFELALSNLISRNEESGKYIIKKENLDAALKGVVQTYNTSRYGHEELTEEEWRDFNAVQSRVIEVKLQCAHKIPVGVSANVNPLNLLSPVNMLKEVCGSLNVNVARSPGLDFDQAIEILKQEFSPYQLALYEKVMGRKTSLSVVTHKELP